MAIGFNLPGIPGQIRGTAEEAGAVPDLGQAMMQGFRSNLENIQGYPRQLAQQLLSNQLANKIKSVEAQYADELVRSEIAKNLRTPASDALLPLRAQALLSQIQKNERAYGGNLPPGHIPLTTPSKSQAQLNTTYINATLKSLEDLYNLPNDKIPAAFGKTSPEYFTAVEKARDQFAKSEKFPGVLPAFKSAQDILKRHLFETPEEYKSRLKNYMNELYRVKKTNMYHLQYGMPISGEYPSEIQSSEYVPSIIGQPQNVAPEKTQKTVHGKFKRVNGKLVLEE